jgi:hypothetical protein
MARSGYRRLNIEYEADALRILDLYCANGIGGLTPTAIMRSLLREFIRQISTHLSEGATTQVIDAAIPIVVENVRARLERTNG